VPVGRRYYSRPCSYRIGEGPAGNLGLIQIGSDVDIDGGEILKQFRCADKTIIEIDVFSQLIFFDQASQIIPVFLA